MSDITRKNLSRLSKQGLCHIGVMLDIQFSPDSLNEKEIIDLILQNV